MTVGVIMPAYNAATSIRRALDSLRSQALQPAEIVVVDDGSVDETAAIAAAFGPPVRVLHRDRGGPAAARNSGVNACTAEAIAFLDADDSLPPESLAARADFLEQNPSVQAVFGQVVFGGRAVPAWLPGGLLVRRSAMVRLGPFDESLRAGEFIDWLDRARRAGLSEALLPIVVLVRDTAGGGRHATRDRAQDFARMARNLLARRRGGLPP